MSEPELQLDHVTFDSNWGESVNQYCNKLIESLQHWSQGTCRSRDVEGCFSDLIAFLNGRASALGCQPVFTSNVRKLKSYLGCIVDGSSSESAVDEAIDDFYSVLVQTLELFPNGAPNSVPSKNVPELFPSSEELVEAIADRVAAKLGGLKLSSSTLNKHPPQSASSETTLEAESPAVVEELQAELLKKDAQLRDWKRRHEDLHNRCDFFKRQLALSSGADSFERLELSGDLEKDNDRSARWCEEACDEGGASDSVFREQSIAIINGIGPKIKKSLDSIWAEINGYRQSIIASQQARAEPDSSRDTQPEITASTLPSISSLKSLENRVQDLQLNAEKFKVTFNDLLKPRLKCIWEDSLRQVVKEQKAVQQTELILQSLQSSLSESASLLATLGEIRSLADKQQVSKLLEKLQAEAAAGLYVAPQQLKNSLNFEIENAVTDSSINARNQALEQLDSSLDRKRSRKVMAPMSVFRYSDSIKTQASPSELVNNSANLHLDISSIIRRQHRQNPRNWRSSRLKAIDELEKTREAVFQSFKQRFEHVSS